MASHHQTWVDLQFGSAPSVRVRALQQTDLAEALAREGALTEPGSDGALIVTGMDSAAIGGIASAYAITLVELAPHGSSLEEAYFDLTKDETDYHASQSAGSTKGI
jgi:ABC-2 type transport system ATP-binding protein